MAELKVHVGDGGSAEDMARRFVDAWHRVERGETANERHLSFDSFEAAARVLTGKRLELLKHLHRHPAPSINALARALGRDYRRVHEDVEALAAAGLIDRQEDGTGLMAPYDAADVQVRIAF